MRYLLFLAPALAIGCGGTTACRDNTFLVNFSFGSGVSADTLDITVDVAGRDKTSSLPLKSGTTHGSIEIDFPGGYPHGSKVTVSVTATLAGATVGSASSSATASASCQTLSVTIGGGGSSSMQDMTPAADMMPMVADMTVVKHQGDACGSHDVCDTGLTCVDGYCCDQPCDGQCQACDVVGAFGTCTTTTDGTPHGSRAACSGSGTCGGACTGASATACTYPSTSVICGAACDGHCDGAGMCTSVAGGTCPNGFACGAGGCNSSCSTDNDCQPNFHCNAPNCQRNPESDCLDGKDNNGDGLADCQDPTCTTVACVPAVPPGDELGIEQASGACPSAFALSEPQFQGLNAPACDNSGCGCDTYVTCDITLSLSASTSCAPKTQLGVMRIEARVGQSGLERPTVQPCQQVSSINLQGVQLNAMSFVGARCTANGTKTPAAPTWSKSEQFCGSSRTSATCAGTQVCAPTAPVGAPLCVRVPSDSASCPAGYTTGMSVWYGSYDDNRSCSCSCTVPGNASCGSNPTVGFGSGTCPSIEGNEGGACSPMIGQCAALNDTDSCFSPPTVTTTAIDVGYLTATGQCGATIANNGSASPTEGSTICCQ